MSNRFGLKAWAEPLRSADFGDITVSLAALGTPLLHPARVLFFTNGTDAIIYLSFTAENNQFALLPGSSLTLDVTTNKSFDEGLYFVVGTQPYIAYASEPTEGSVYLSIVYGTTDLNS